MGRRGQEQMAAQTIAHVVGDLLKWYERGILARRKRPFWSVGIALLQLLLSVPFGVFALGCYDLLMWLLLVVVGYSPIDHLKSRCVSFHHFPLVTLATPSTTPSATSYTQITPSWYTL